MPPCSPLKKKVSFDWDIVCQPTGPDKNAKVVSGFAGYFVTKASTHQSLAVNLVKYLTGKKIMTIERLNEELIREKIHHQIPGVWEPSGEWDREWSNDRLWS